MKKAANLSDCVCFRIRITSRGMSLFRITQGNGCLNIIDCFDETAIVRPINDFVEQGLFLNMGERF